MEFPNILGESVGVEAQVQKVWEAFGEVYVLVNSAVIFALKATQQTRHESMPRHWVKPVYYS